MNNIEVMEQALEALNSFPHRHLTPFISDARKSLRTALEQAHAAQPAPVPLTEQQKQELAENWFAEDWAITKAIGMMYDHDRLLRSTTPPAPQPVPVKTYHDGKPWPVAPKPWVGLAEDEVEDCARGCANHAELARAVEAELKEKNT